MASTGAQSAPRTWPHVPVSLFVSSGAWHVPVQGSDLSTLQSSLHPLHEAAHANALNTLTVPNPASIGLQVPNSPEDEKNMTNVEKCRHWALADGYDGIAIELANARWHERWEHLCLRPDSDTPGLPRSTSRANFSSLPGDMDARIQLEAETWRAQPHFLRPELNILHARETPYVLSLIHI